MAFDRELVVEPLEIELEGIVALAEKSERELNLAVNRAERCHSSL